MGHVLTSRVNDAVEQALKLTKGLVTVRNETTRPPYSRPFEDDRGGSYSTMALQEE